MRIEGDMSKNHGFRRYGLRTFCSLLGAAVLVAAATVFIFFLPQDVQSARRSTSFLCMECHPEAKELISKGNVHKPVKLGLCTSCHNPHASKHANLIGSDINALCYNCHDQRRVLAGTEVHAPVEEGACLECHDPHSSNQKGLLKKTASEACYSCHPRKDISAKKNVHPEVKKGNCLGCHRPHASDRAGLLTKDRRRLCTGCHSAKDERLVSSHRGLNVAKADCIGCHSPHSSDNVGILKASMHKPFKDRKCGACHLPGSSKVSRAGTGLCTECHESKMSDFNKRYSHLVNGDGLNPCVNCHNPHSSDEEYLLKDKEERLCFSCHEDTEKLTAKSNFTHAEIQKCSSCHVSHGSNEQYFLAAGEDTCSTEQCHATQGRFTHPVGDEVIDPRSNTPMNCSTCHNPMGSPEEFILRGGKDRELCIQCHQV